MKIKTTLIALVSLMVISLTGCMTNAKPEQNLPIRWGTIVDMKPSYRKDVVTSGAGTAAGAVAGGVVGHQMGKGDGKKIMTGLGAILGAAAANEASKKEVLVQTSAVIIADDETKEAYHVMLDGNWRVGMKIRYSVIQNANGDYQIIVR